MSMTDTTFDPQSHPRNAASGRFAEVLHTAPEASLSAPSLTPQAVQADIEAVTHGRDALERAIGAGRFGFRELSEAQQLVWNGAAGPGSGSSLDSVVDAGSMPLTASNIERVLEVTHYRAQSGRYEVSDSGDLALIPVDVKKLRDADWQAEGRSEHAGEMMNAGQPIGPEAEISADAARLFAEDALQNLPAGLPMTRLPRLAEFANTPYTEASGTDPAKIDALHDELARIRESHDYLAPHKQRRLDMLATFATHALPGQA